MSTRRFLRTALLILALGTVSTSVMGQMAVRSLIGNGGVRITDGTYVVRGSIGQTANAATNDAVTGHGAGFWYTVDPGSGVISDIEMDGDGLIPDVLTLGLNYPNPFKTTTTVRIGLPEATLVSLSIYNMLGQQVATLVRSEKAAGYYTVVWDGRSSANEVVPAGMYIMRLSAGEERRTGKMILVR